MRNAFERVVDAFHELDAQALTSLLVPLIGLQQIGLCFGFER
jgi:hypothetical protein